jgi:hypothetical protein
MPATDDPPASPPPDAMPARAILVLGMHRSGTSAVAGSLHRLGVDFGPRLMPPTPDNVRGYFEHIDIVNLHDRLLLAAGSSWYDTDPKPPGWPPEAETARFRDDLRELLRRDFGAAPLWGVKDPRLCRLLPWWQPLWVELRVRPLFVIVLRDPREVAASLARRDGFSAGKAYLLWLLHVLAAERATRQEERVFVDFADFLTDWRAALAPVGTLLGRPWPVSVPPDTSAEQFIDRALLQAGRLPAEGEMPLWVEEVDAALRRDRRPDPELLAVLDRVAAQVQAAQHLYGGAGEQENDLTRELAILQQQARWYEAEWQKARHRLGTSRESLERAQKEAESLRLRILDLERIVADVRLMKLSDMRIGRGAFREFLNRFLRF